MSNPNECIICSRSTEEGEHFVETDDGYVCCDCMMDIKEIRGEYLKESEHDPNQEG